MEKPTHLPPFHLLGLVIVAAALLIPVLIVIIFRELAFLLQPLFIAVFLFYIARPMIRKLTRLKIPTPLATALVVLLFVAAACFVAWIVGSQMGGLSDQFPLLRQRFRGMMGSVADWMISNIPFLDRRFHTTVVKQTDPQGQMQVAVTSAMSGAGRWVGSAGLVVFYLIFIFHEANVLPKRLRLAFGAERASKMIDVGHRINEGIIGYIYIKFMISLLTAVLAVVIMTAYGLDLVLLWGVIVFLLNFIPFIGSLIAYAFPISFSLLKFQNPWMAVALTASLFTMDTIVGNYIEPRYAGQRLNLSPLIVMVSLVFWSWLWGLVGLILAVPILVSLKFILENIPLTKSMGILLSHDHKGLPTV